MLLLALPLAFLVASNSCIAFPAANGHLLTPCQLVPQGPSLLSVPSSGNLSFAPASGAPTQATTTFQPPVCSFLVSLGDTPYNPSNDNCPAPYCLR